jgi:hypothetical protein
MIRTNTEKVDSLNDSLLGTAQASAKGRAEIVEYIGKLNGIPPDKQTEILTLLNQGKVDEAKAVLDAASTTRTVAVEADASEFNADVAAAKKEAAKPVIVPIKYRDDSIKGPKAHGGTVGQRGGVAGEAGEEFVKLPGKPTMLIDSPMYVPPGTRVTSVRKTREIRQGRRPPRRFANGTQLPAPVTVGSGTMSFTFNQQAPIYGVADLDRHLERWANTVLAPRIKAGKR